MNELNEILLRRRHKVIAEPSDAYHFMSKNECATLVAGLKNIQSLGFTFSKELFEKVEHFTKKEFEDFYKTLVPELSWLVSADVEYRPMYPNFPRQVADASASELFLNAMHHYMYDGEIPSRYKKDVRMPLIDDNKMVVLSAGSENDLLEILSNLLSSKTSLSRQDKEDVMTIIKNCPMNYGLYLPDEIPLKENVALLGKYIIEDAPIISMSTLKKYFKTATDVLRLVTALSDGDISLATNTKYRSMRRSVRRIILELLSECGNIIEDLFRYRNKWIRVAEIIHPTEYICRKYDDVATAFQVLRNKRKPLMFNGRVQEAIRKKDMSAAAGLLIKRPGEFARQLDKLLRESDFDDRINILFHFKSVADKVSSPVLLQVRQHFLNRMSNKREPIRVFFPKGNLAKATSVRNNLPNIYASVCKDVVWICEDALAKQYAEKQSMGNVYIDDKLKNYVVPFNQRSASASTKTIVRGSKLPIGNNTNAIRGFIWWTNEAEGYRVDIDISMSIYDKNWCLLNAVSYSNLRAGEFKAYHSGDIVNGGDVDGDGVAEFIDFDIDSVTKNGGRYIVYQVYSYTGQYFSDLQNCRFGWMERNDVYSGEIFEPKTVQMKIDLTANSTVEIPVIFDCKERKFIWCDMNLRTNNSWFGGVNLESNVYGVTAVCYAMTHMNKPNLYDLVMLNAKARGNIVVDKKKADIIFAGELQYNDKGIPAKARIVTPFDADYFMGQLL